MRIATTCSIVLTALASLALSGGCRSTSVPIEVAFERVQSGQMGFGGKGGLGLEARNAVVRDLAEWRAFCADDVLGDDESAWSLVKSVDWSRNMVIAVNLGSRPSGGYAVAIDRVMRKGSHWIVHARETRPAPGSLQTAMLTSPFDCVATPRFEGKVEFVVE